MRFRQLQLIAFGPFTNRTLSFESHHNQLHLIHGPNEAGKSSSLRAITDFLYGIPARTSDDFLHPYNKLRIGAILERSDGTVLHAIRRKANQNALRCGQDKEVIEDQVLASFTGALAKDIFLSMHGLNHERLRLGGEAIVRGTGHIGSLLFASAAGITDLRPLQAKIAEETDVLMTSAGRSGAIVEKIKLWKDLQAEAKEAQLSVEEWNQFAERVTNLEHEKDELDAAIASTRTQLSRLQRISSAIPIATKLAAAQTDFDNVRDAPDLPETFVAQVHELLTGKSLQSLTCKQTEDRLNQLEDEIKGLVVSDEILAARISITRLREKYGIILKSKEDIPKRLAERDSAINKCGEILQRLGYERDRSNIDQLVLLDSERIRILELGREQSKLQADELNATQNYTRIQNDLLKLQAAIGNDDKQIDTTQLEAEVEAAQKDGDLESLLSKMKNEVSKIDSEAIVRLKQLSPWTGSLEQLDVLSIPTQSTIVEFQKAFQELHQKSSSIQTQLQQHREALDEDLLAIEELQRNREILTFAELLKSRNDRDSLWQLVLDAWKNGVPSEEQNPQTWKQLGLFESNSSHLREAYESSVKRADSVADAMRENADVVAKKEAFQLSIPRKKRLIEAQLEQLAENHSSHDSLQKKWQQLWQPCGIEAKTPQEMFDWLHRAEQVRELAAQLRIKRIEIISLENRICHHVLRIREMLSSFTSANSDSQISRQNSLEVPPKDTLASVLKSAKKQIAEVQKQQNQRAIQIVSMEATQVELGDAERVLQTCKVAHDHWRKAWASQMQRINLTADATPAQAESVLTNLQQLISEHRNVKALTSRIEGMKKDIEDFNSELTDLAERLAPHLIDRPHEEIVTSLDKLRENNEFNQSRMDEKRAEILVKKETLLADRQKLDRVEASIRALCEQSGCTDVSELLEVGHQSEAKRLSRVRVFDCEEQLMQFSGGMDLSTFLAEVKSERERADQLPTQMEELESTLKTLSERRDQTLGHISECKAQIAQWNGSGVAADKIAQSEGVAAELSELTRRLAVMRLGSALLNSAIERHRKKNQAPVMSRASSLFSKLTCGAFSGLQTDYDDQGPVLVAERATGERVALAGLSEGTADQLYLALRIASLEEWLKRHEPVPFVVDDILITFDDRRSEAALDVLAELSNKTQVLFFTHHQHVTELAKSTVAPSRVCIHSLVD